MATPAEIKAAKIEEFKQAKASDAKAKILARRDQLLANGYDPASAMQVAFDEVSGAGEFAKRVEAKKPKELPTPIAPGGRAPTAEELKTYREALKPAKPVKTEEELASEEGQRQTLRANQQLKQAEAEFVSKRAQALQASGFSPAIATQMAQQEFSESYGEPQQAGFGKKADIPFQPAAAKPDFMPGSAGFFDALRPQVIYPTANIQEELRRADPARGALETSASIIGSGIDFASVRKSMLKDMSEAEADDQIEALKAAYSKNLVEELSGIPNFASIRAGDASAKELTERVYKRTIDELASISSVEKLGSKPAGRPAGSTLENIAGALEGQETSGGVPDYSPTQLEYLRVLGDRIKAKEKQERLGKETKTVYEIDGKIISEEEYTKRAAGFREDTDTSRYKKLQVPKTEKDLDKELTIKYKQPWYLDPDKKKEYLANPEKYKDEGFFKDTDIYGNTRETTASWLLRSALILPNAVAGAVTPLIFEGMGENQALIEEERRKRRPEAYKDSPILYNIAQNRGFTGEGVETAEIMGLEGAEKGLYIAGTFGADLLDPTLDIAKGAGAGAKAAKNSYKAIGALGSLSPTQAARLKAAAKAGLAKGIDETIESSFLSLVGGRGKSITETANARSLATATLSDSLDDAVKVEDQIRATADLASTDVKLGTSAYAKKFAEASAADKTAAQVREELSQAAKRAGDDALELAKDISVGIDEIITKGSTKLIRSKELGRQLGALSAVDNEVAATLKAVDDAKKTDRPKLQQYLEALEEGKRALLKRGLSQDLASRTIFTRTKDVSELENLVAATKNTFVDKRILPNVMKQATDSPIGQISNRLRGSPIFFKASDNQIVQAVKLPDADVEPLKNIVLDLERSKRITPADIERINRSISQKKLLPNGEEVLNGNIGIKDFRMLVDATIDEIAEGVARSKPAANVTRARDIARLSGSQQKAFLAPLESRSFTRQGIKDELNKFIYKKDPSSKLSFGQQKLLQEATARLGNLDTSLVITMKDLMGGKADILKAYGIAEGTKLTREQALAYAIVGPARNPAKIEDVLNFAIDSIFYTKKTRQILFDVFYGTSVSRETGIFSKLGQDALYKQVTGAAEEIAKDPTRLWEELKFIIDDFIKPNVEAVKADPNAPAAAYLKEPNFAEDIINIADKSMPPEVSLSLYYKSEADKIVDNILEDLTTKNVGTSTIKLGDAFTTEEFDRLERILSDNNIVSSLGEIAPNIIKERLKKLLKDGRASLREPLTADDIDILFAGKANSLAADPNFIRDANIIVEAADDIASTIARRNELKGLASADQVETTIKNLKDDVQISARLKAIYGEQAAKELTEGLQKGFKDLRNEVFNSIIKSVDSEDKLTRARAVLSRLNDIYNTLFYNLILTVNPRFHGGNIQTAAEIAYATTGKLPNPVDVINGAKLPYTSKVNPNGILLEKGAGPVRPSSNPRFYTNREVYEMLKMEGGRSLYSAALPSVNTRRALNLIDDKSYNKFTEGLRILGETPQQEDMAFRYAIFADAIREGRSESEAIALARAAMYDVSDIGEAERKIQNIILFYGWARNNFVTFVKNTLSSEGRKRIIKTLSTQRSAEEIAKDLADINEDEAKYVKGRAPTQLILNKLPREEGSDKDIYNLSTRNPQAEAIKLFGDLISNPAGVLKEKLNPGLKLAFGVEDTFSENKRMVSPEHVYLLKEAADNEGADYLSVLNVIVGGEIKPRKARPDEKSVDGYVYPLVTQNQRDRYQRFIQGLSITGMSRAMSDYYKLASGQGTPARSATGALGTAAYAAAITNPIETAPAWKQELYSKYAKLSAIQGKEYKAPSGVGALDQEFIKDIVEIDPNDPARIKAAAETRKDFLEGAEEVAADIEEKTIYDMTVQELLSELSRPNLLKLLRTKFNGDEDALDAYVEEIEARIDKLETESEKLNRRK